MTEEKTPMDMQKRMLCDAVLNGVVRKKVKMLEDLPGNTNAYLGRLSKLEEEAYKVSEKIFENNTSYAEAVYLIAQFGRKRF